MGPWLCQQSQVSSPATVALGTGRQQGPGTGKGSTSGNPSKAPAFQHAARFPVSADGEDHGGAWEMHRFRVLTSCEFRTELHCL